MPITEHYQGQTHNIPEQPTRRPVFKGADGRMWMIVRDGELTLPQYIEGRAKGWITNKYQMRLLTMQVKGETRKYADGSIDHGYYFVGDHEKRFIDRSIKQPSAQK